MRHALVVPAGARRPGRPSHDGGAVTVEAALVLLGLTVVLAAVLWCVGLLGAQLALGEAARGAVRVAARGETGSAVQAEARRLVPDAAVSVTDDGDHVAVEITRVLRPPGALGAWGSVELRAGAVAARELP